MTSQISSQRLAQLRRDARKLQKSQTGLPRHEALDIVAQREGFQNWSLVSKHTEQVPVPRSKAFVPQDARQMVTGLRMDASASELHTIMGIVERYFALVGDMETSDRLSIMMDIEACHCNGCPIDLIALHEAARDQDLVHDVAGISRHLDRESGKLEGFFRPRYAARARYPVPPIAQSA